MPKRNIIIFKQASRRLKQRKHETIYQYDKRQKKFEVYKERQ